jgi:hypothetical protein
MNKKMKIAILVVSIGIIISASSLYYYLGKNNRTDEKPNLELEISFPKDEYSVNESLPITIYLKNMGNRSVSVCEMSLELGTLDLKIQTPDGFEINYGGPYIDTVPHPKSIAPKKQIVINYDLYHYEFGIEGVDNGTWYFDQYNFTHVGNYTVQGIYWSGTAIGGEVWHGTMSSNVVSFKIEG